MTTWDAGAKRRNYRAAPGQNVAHAIEGAGAPVDGTTGAGEADRGWTYINTANGMHYINTGTMAAPVWSLVIT